MTKHRNGFDKGAIPICQEFDEIIKINAELFKLLYANVLKKSKGLAGKIREGTLIKAGIWKCEISIEIIGDLRL